MTTVYSFSFINASQLINVSFVKDGAEPFSGADHAVAHSVRRDFALSLIPAMAINVWLPLNSHEYLDILAMKGFMYTEYCCTFESRDEVRIVIA